MVAAVALGGALFAQGRLESSAQVRGDSDHLLYLPSGRLLKVLDLGYSEVLADLVYLWSIQYYGNYPGGVRYDYLLQIYDRVITELDPRFADAYVLGAAILSVEAHRPEDAIRLLDKGVRANPEDWMLPFEAGFVAYHDLHDYPRAAAYFATAIERPGVHPVVRRFHAEMFNRAGDRETSRRYWEEILRTADSDYLRGVAARHVHDLTVEIDLAHLREAIAEFIRVHGSNPADLRDLVRGGLLRVVPVDPDGRPYVYDRTTGSIARARGRSAP